MADSGIRSSICVIHIVRIAPGMTAAASFARPVEAETNNNLDTFEIKVPQMAKNFPVLLNAIFALSARHLGQTLSDSSQRKKYNRLADMHNEACINIIQNLLMSKDYQSGWTEHLFAATIILQVMEEMNGTSTVEEWRDHHWHSRKVVTIC